jgi:hypothetical protein
MYSVLPRVPVKLETAVVMARRKNSQQGRKDQEEKGDGLSPGLMARRASALGRRRRGNRPEGATLTDVKRLPRDNRSLRSCCAKFIVEVEE